MLGGIQIISPAGELETVIAFAEEDGAALVDGFVADAVDGYVEIAVGIFVGVPAGTRVNAEGNEGVIGRGAKGFGVRRGRLDDVALVPFGVKNFFGAGTHEGFGILFGDQGAGVNFAGAGDGADFGSVFFASDKSG